MVRDEGVGFINWDWGSGSPSSGCGINPDNFSVRWKRVVTFPAGYYTRFKFTGDDGIRLYIDGILKSNFWNVTAGERATDIELPAGTHEVRLEYQEFGGLAVARLS